MAVRCISPLLDNLKNISNIVKIGGGGAMCNIIITIDNTLLLPSIILIDCQF